MTDTNPSIIDLSTHDLQRFGVVTARARVNDVTDVTRCDEFCEANGVKLLIVRCPTSAIETVQAFEDGGGRLMDCLVGYRRELRKYPLEDARDLTWVREARPEDAAGISSIVARAFAGYRGHYHADRRLDDAAADEAYRDWAMRSCTEKGVADRIFVAWNDDTIVGFVAVRCNSPIETETILAAVAPEAQGRGIPHSLGVKTLRWSADIGARRSIVFTQITNLAMQRALFRHRFEAMSSYFTLHKWYDR